MRRAALACTLAACGGAEAPTSATEMSSGTGSSTAAASTAVVTTGAPATTTTGDLPTGGSAGDSQGTTAGPETTSSTTTGSVDATTTTTTGEASTSTGEASTGEASTTDGTTGEPPADALRLHHVQVRGTHNSYHVEPALPFDATHEYTHEPLDVQLGAQGVRAFELDVHQGIRDFEVYHISVIDSSTTCESLGECLGVVKLWSNANLEHMPVVVWMEIKDSTGGLPIDAADLDAIDELIEQNFPKDRLFTPDDLQGAYDSPRAALEAEGWPTIDALRGQVIVVLLNVDDDHSENYTSGWTTLAGRAMFARATPGQFALPWAAIAKLGIGDDADVAAAHAAHMLIATNVCAAGDDADDCTGRLEDAKAAGIHMLKDDFPAKVDGFSYFLDIPDGSPARCNPVTAPPSCTSAAIESL